MSIDVYIIPRKELDVKAVTLKLLRRYSAYGIRKKLSDADIVLDLSLAAVSDYMRVYRLLGRMVSQSLLLAGVRVQLLCLATADLTSVLCIRLWLLASPAAAQKELAIDTCNPALLQPRQI